MTQKKPFSSKKFIAFFFAMLLVGGVMIAALVTQDFNWAMTLFMTAGMFTVGFLSVGYILSQKALDQFVEGVYHLGGSKQDHSDLER